MKKAFWVLAFCLLASSVLHAESTTSSQDGQAVPASSGAAAETAKAPEAQVPAAETTAPVTATPVAAAPAGQPAAADESTAAEDLEFVSGEISAMDEASKTVSVKLYGETENSTDNKIISIKVEGATDITDGEKDRDLKSLTVGTEVDVEYDPATNKATYIFVY